tara:strand:+ start:326 stop:865 length:540 start_codon:yes stop_codon:yes gene_type:complete
MDKKLILISSIFFVISIFFIFNLSNQKKYKSQNSQLVLINKNEIHKIIISAKEDAIELIKKDTTWSISGNDSLKIKDNYIDNFLDKIFQLNKKHLVTSKENNWNTYGVNAEKGSHLALINNKGETISYFIFGRTKNDFNSCYVKIEKEFDVYLLDNNIINQLQTNINYWGEPIMNPSNK